MFVFSEKIVIYSMENGYNHLACAFFTFINVFSAIDCFRPFHFNR